MLLSRATLGHRSSGQPWFIPLVVFALFLLAGLVGLLLSLGAHVYSFVLVGALLGVFLVCRPDLMFGLLFLLVFLVDGLAQTLIGVGQVQWLISGLGLALLSSHFLRISRPRFRPVEEQGVVFTPITITVGLFFLTLIGSSLINNVGFGQAAVGGRSYVPLWGVFFFVGAGYLTREDMRRVFFTLLIFATIQWPFAVYQHFFVAAEREALRIFGSSWDSVVGTFGGSKFGGGQSSSLGVFLVLVIILATSLLRHRQISKRSYFFLICSIFLALGLAETKVIFVLIPFGLAVLFRAEIVRHPVLAVGGAIVMCAVLAGVLYSYHSLYWDGRRNIDVSEDIIGRFTYSFEPDYYAAGVWPGRVTALNIWAAKNDFELNPAAMLVGHGAAAAVSNSTVIGQGKLTQQYGLGLEASGASKLLWETGLLGLFSFLLLPTVGFFSAGFALTRGIIGTQDRAILEAVQAAMPLFAIVVFYETTVVSVPPMQFLLFLSLGYIQYWYLRTRSSNR